MWISEKDMGRVEGLPILLGLKNDRIVWPYERFGQLNVRFAYTLINEGKKGRQMGNASSSYMMDNKIWKMIWKINCQPNIFFFWCAELYLMH